MKYIVSLFCFLLLNNYVIANPISDTLFNQTDSLGRKQGYWKGFLLSEKNEIVHVITSITYYTNDLRDSICLEFYGEFNNYALMNKSRFKKDKRHGECYFFLPNGDTNYIVNYSNGKRHGWSKYYEMGKIRQEEEFIDGAPTGVMRDYYSNTGRLLSVSYQINGVENGTRRIYSDDEKGELLHEYDFKNGIKIVARHYEKGFLVKEEKFDYEKGLKKDEKIRKKLKKKGLDEYL